MVCVHVCVCVCMRVCARVYVYVLACIPANLPPHLAADVKSMSKEELHHCKLMEKYANIWRTKTKKGET